MNSEKEALDLPAIVTGNGEAYPKQWLAVYVRLYHEKKTSARLNTMGIENFLPIQEEIHQWSDRRKKISRVLIPMIVFVHVDALERKKVLELYSGEFYQFNLSSCIRQQNSLTAQFVSFSLSNLANIFYPPQFLQ